MREFNGAEDMQAAIDIGQDWREINTQSFNNPDGSYIMSIFDL